MGHNIAASGRSPFARARARVSRFRSDRSGATVVEFAVLAFPFFLLLFAILELALIFYISSAVDNAVSDASRSVRVGQLQDSNTTATAQLTTFRSDVCAGLSAFPNCEQKVRVILKRSTSGAFSGTLTSAKDNELDCSGPREVVLLRVSYEFGLILPGKWTRLANAPNGSNAHMITSTTAFRNEPFPTSAGTSCGTASFNNPSGTVTTPPPSSTPV